MNGARHLCEILIQRDVSQIFGLPGTQNTHLFSELRRTKIDSFVATHEMAAGFAALGYAATSNKAAVMAIIGGPGLTYALTPLQEARLDSIPIVCLVFVADHNPRWAFHTQQIDHHSIAGSACKTVLEVNSLSALANTFDLALKTAIDGEPGPVVVLVKSHLMEEQIAMTEILPPRPNDTSLDFSLVQDVLSRVSGKRVLLLAGRGCLPCSKDILALAERLGAPVLTSTSARGVVPEDHNLAVKSDLVPHNLISAFINQFDCILALGIKFSENSSRRFRLVIPPEKLVHIDQGLHVVGKNFEARTQSVTNVSSLVAALLNTEFESADLNMETLDDWRSRFHESLSKDYEPTFEGIEPPTPERFFEQLGAAIPDDTILVTDSGNHQMLTRKYYVCRSGNGLLIPTNFQSMGFAVSAAMGAKLASPDRTVVALIGDGGLQMSGLELAVAVRENLNVVVIVFNDGHFGLIRKIQLGHDGYEYGVSLPRLNIEDFAGSIGVGYENGSTNLASAFERAILRSGPTVIEIILGDSTAIRRMQATSRAKDIVRKTLGKKFVNFVKRFS